MGGVFGSAVDAIKQTQVQNSAVLGAAVGGVLFIITKFVKV